MNNRLLSGSSHQHAHDTRECDQARATVARRKWGMKGLNFSGVSELVH